MLKTLDDIKLIDQCQACRQVCMYLLIILYGVETPESKDVLMSACF